VNSKILIEQPDVIGRFSTMCQDLKQIVKMLTILVSNADMAVVAFRGTASKADTAIA